VRELPGVRELPSLSHQDRKMIIMQTGNLLNILITKVTTLDVHDICYSRVGNTAK
jgi:hypothetical protein